MGLEVGAAIILVRGVARRGHEKVLGEGGLVMFFFLTRVLAVWLCSLCEHILSWARLVYIPVRVLDVFQKFRMST